MHIRRIFVAKYPYPFKQGNYYPYTIRIRENCGSKYLSADAYPRLSGCRLLHPDPAIMYSMTRADQSRVRLMFMFTF